MPVEAEDRAAAGVGLARRGGQSPRVSLSGGVCRASFPPLSRACGWRRAAAADKDRRPGKAARVACYGASAPDPDVGGAGEAEAPGSRFLLSVPSPLRAEHQNGGGARRWEFSGDTAPRTRAGLPPAGGAVSARRARLSGRAGSVARSVARCSILASFPGPSGLQPPRPAPSAGGGPGCGADERVELAGVRDPSGSGAVSPRAVPLARGRGARFATGRRQKTLPGLWAEGA